MDSLLTIRLPPEWLVNSWNTLSPSTTILLTNPYLFLGIPLTRKSSLIPWPQQCKILSWVPTISHTPWNITPWKISIILHLSATYSVQFSCSIVSDSLWPHGLQHARLLCPSLTPRAYSNSCPSSQWCHPSISFSVIPFFFCLQSCPASGSFPMGHFFASGGHSIGVSASASAFQWIFRTDFL